MNRFFFLLTICISALLFTNAYAAAGDPSVIPANFALYMPLLLPLLASLAAFVRSVSPASGFFHTQTGHVALMFTGALLSAGTDWLRAGNLSKTALIAAIGGGIAAWAGALKPAGTGRDKLQLPPN